MQCGLEIEMILKQTDTPTTAASSSDVAPNTYAKLLQELEEFRNPRSMDDIVERLKINTRASFCADLSQANVLNHDSLRE